MLVPPLSTRLREGTRDSHRLAETTPFIRLLFSGNLPLTSYRHFLTQLLHIYTALETSRPSHPVLDLLDFPQLHRRASLELDLAHYFGDDPTWRSAPPAPATLEYVNHIHQVARYAPEKLVAHHYTRYLGDLSGGQAMRRIVQRMYPQEDQAGVAFYDFPAIPDHNAFKDEYRARLDALPVNESTAQAIVDEANLAFLLNRKVFEGMLETAAS